MASGDLRFVVRKFRACKRMMGRLSALSSDEVTAGRLRALVTKGDGHVRSGNPLLNIR